MHVISVTCPVCGAKIPGSPPPRRYICYFCRFEQHADHQSNVSAFIPVKKYFEDLPHLLKINPVAKIYIEGNNQPDLAHNDTEYPVKLIVLTPDHVKIKALWSEMMLPFQENLAEYFSQRFHQLVPGGLLYLSTPVKRHFQEIYPLSGQINFFTSKNIMFLLEQHGFKLQWRKNRFAGILRIIARKSK